MAVDSASVVEGGHTPDQVSLQLGEGAAANVLVMGLESQQFEEPWNDEA